MCIRDRHDPGLYIDQSTVPDMPDLLWLATHNNCVISVSSVLVKKQAILDIGLFDSRYTSCDDFDAWLKIRMIAPIVHPVSYTHLVNSTTTGAGTAAGS